MVGWLDFIIIFFWLSIGLFFLNNYNFVSLLLFAELTWLVLFSLCVIIGANNNDIISMSFTFFILGFGGLEFVIGLMLVVLLKNFNIGVTSEADKNSELFSNIYNHGNTNSKKWNV